MYKFQYYKTKDYINGQENQVIYIYNDFCSTKENYTNIYFTYNFLNIKHTCFTKFLLNMYY
jgi:hypothetical protein